MSNITSSSIPAAWSRNVAILTCMDTRVDPIKLLKLQLGEAHIIRNAGGRATEDAIRSLVISAALLDAPAVLVIHHTDCAMGRLTNEQLREQARKRSNVAVSRVSRMDFLPFTNLDQSVRDDVAKIAVSPLIENKIVATGLVYDLSTGQLRKICSL